MRLFLAVNFNAGIKSRLFAVQENIKKQALRGKFSRRENFHLTLVFIGETDAGLAPAVRAIIEDAIQPVPAVFSVTLSRTGCFRHSGKELWWLGADDDAVGEAAGCAVDDGGDGLRALTALRRRISGALETAGVPFDKRPFKAHITLGREIKSSAPIVLPRVIITVPVTRISLMKSEHFGGVLTYTEIAGWNLA